MTPFRNSIRLAGVILFAVQLCVAASAQEKTPQSDLGIAVQSSSNGQTGAGGRNSAIAAAKSGQADGTGNSQLEGRRPLYRLTRSDAVAVSFTLSPEFDQIVTIQPDGYVALKDAGPVLAQGLTLEEFREAVMHAYTGYLHDPQVTAVLKDFEHPYFIAGGEVGRPGKYQLRADTNILEAVEIAGGFTHEAKHSQVLLFRHVNNDLIEAHLYNVRKMLKQRSLTEAAQLQPGDLVFVPRNIVSKIAPFLTRPSVGMYVDASQF
jgi:polysaccharide biosynthesis/export protein